MNYTSNHLLALCIGFSLITGPIRVLADNHPSILQQLDAYILEQTATGRIDKADSTWKQKLPVFPSIDFSVPYRVWAVMETPAGSVRIAFRPDAAPRHVANFLYLARLGYYDGAEFQYVAAGQRVVWGCPIGNGQGTPGYTFDRELPSALSHNQPGILSAMNGGKQSDGSVMFISVVPMPWLDEVNTAFGVVESGLDAIRAWTDRDAIARPISPHIISIQLMEERIAEEESE